MVIGHHAQQLQGFLHMVQPLRAGDIVAVLLLLYKVIRHNPEIALKQVDLFSCQVRNLEQVDEIIKNKPNDFDVISGDDALTFPMVSCGAVGVISVIGNALPKEFSKMIRLQMRGEYDPARKIHHRFTDLFSLLFVDGNPAGVKAMLSEMGFIQNKLRLPLVPMRIKNMQRMSDILKELKI